MKKYFLVKHDLASLKLLPGFVWNDEVGDETAPRGFAQIEKDDEWVALAYKVDNSTTVSLRQVTGFYQCIMPHHFGELPPAAGYSEKRGWMIRGEPVSPHVAAPTDIPPLTEFISRPLYHSKTVTELERSEYDKIRRYVEKATGPATPKYVSATKGGVYRKEARQCLQYLVAHVFSCKAGPVAPITYQELARRIGRLNKHGIGHGHGMGKVLGVMGHLLEDVDGDWGEGIPKIQSLVVNKAGPLKDLPDAGIKEFWPRYEQLTRKEKISHVEHEYRRIVEFGSRWDQVLEKLGLPPVVSKKTGTGRSGGGGESPEHRMLQEYIRDNPHLVGIDASWTCDENYCLPSLDEIDLLFRSQSKCLAVEVKSHLSDRMPEDYERGIYQTVKYASLLRAMHTGGRRESRALIEAVLLLERTLPAVYRELANKLGVRVIENIRIPAH